MLYNKHISKNWGANTHTTRAKKTETSSLLISLMIWEKTFFSVKISYTHFVVSKLCRPKNTLSHRSYTEL